MPEDKKPREIVRIGVPRDGIALDKLQAVLAVYADETAGATVRHYNGNLIVEAPA